TELGLPSSAGLSQSRVVSKIAATMAKPRGLIYVPPGSEKEFLIPLAVELIPGVGPKTHKLFSGKEIKTIGDLLKRPELAARFLDLGEAQRRERRHDHSIGNETTLDKPLRDKEPMEAVLWDLVEEVGSRLRREELYARCLTLKIRYTNFQTISRSCTLPAPTVLTKKSSMSSAICCDKISAKAERCSSWA